MVDFEGAAHAADNLHFSAYETAQNLIASEMGKVTQDNSTRENLLWLQEQAAIASYNYYKAYLELPGTEWAAPFSETDALLAIQNYHIASTRLGLEGTIRVSDKVVAATIADATSRKDMAISVGDAAYTEAVQTALAAWNFADASATEKGAYMRALAALEAPHDIDLETRSNSFELQRLGYWLALETEKSLAEQEYQDAVALAQRNKDGDYAQAQRLYDRAVAQADKDQAYALATADETRDNALAQAEVTKATTLQIPYITFGGTVNTAIVSFQQTVAAASVQYTSSVANARVVHVTTIETARAASIIAAANGDPAVAAVANAQAAQLIANAQADAAAEIADAMADQAAMILDGLAWKLAADAEVMLEAQQAVTETQTGAAWVAAAAAADRDAAEDTADANYDADLDAADLDRNAALAEASANQTRTVSANAAGQRGAVAQAQNAVTRDTASVNNGLTSFIASTNADQTRAVGEANALEALLKGVAFAEMDRVVDRVSARHDEVVSIASGEFLVIVNKTINDMSATVQSARNKWNYYVTATLTSFRGELNAGERLSDYLWNDGLDIATDFFAGWANTLTGGAYGLIVGNTYGTYINWNSTAYHTGVTVGTVHSFLIGIGAGSPCTVGWVATVSRTLNTLQTVGGMVQAGSNILNGNGTVWDALALAPLGGRALGMTGLFGCFVAGTPVATEWSSAPVVVGMDAGAAPALFDTVSVLVGATGIALGTVAVRRRRKGDAEEAASRLRSALDEPDLIGDDAAERNRSMLPSSRPPLTVGL